MPLPFAVYVAAWNSNYGTAIHRGRTARSVCCGRASSPRRIATASPRPNCAALTVADRRFRLRFRPSCGPTAECWSSCPGRTPAAAPASARLRCSTESATSASTRRRRWLYPGPHWFNMQIVCKLVWWFNLIIDLVDLFLLINVWLL